MGDDQQQIGRYTTRKFLGCGAFGSVVKASKSGSERWFAIKRISKQSILRTDMVGQVKKEITIMKTLEHPNIVRTEEVLMSSTYVYICMEYVGGGELAAMVASSGSLSDALASRFTRQICEAMNFCHLRQICHRDIKPQNILVDHRDNVKLVDFGFASFMEVDTEVPDDVSFQVENENGLTVMDIPDVTLKLSRSANAIKLKEMRTYCGTIQYMAPEIEYGRYFGDKVDMWAIGMVVYFMLKGCLPGDIKPYVDNRPRFVDNLSRDGSVSRGARNVMRNLLVRQTATTTRYSASEILLDDWLRPQESVHDEDDVERSGRVMSSISIMSEEEDDSDSTTDFSLVVAKDFDTNGETMIEYIKSILEGHEYERGIVVNSNVTLTLSITTSTGFAYLVVSVLEGEPMTIHVENTSGECSYRRMMSIRAALEHMEMS